MGFYFDGATASEPVLEVWDNKDTNTYNIIALGEGSALNSWFRGITTTDGLPGTNWVGSKLAGAGEGYYLLLNNDNGPLDEAGTLYCNLKIVIPSTITAGGTVTPVIVCKYTSN